MSDPIRSAKRRARYASDVVERQKNIESCRRRYREHKAERLAYMKANREANPEIFAARKAAYYQRNKQKEIDRVKRWAVENREAKRAYAREYRAKNAERDKPRRKETYLKHRDAVIKRSCEWNKNNPERAAQFRAAYQRSPAGRKVMEHSRHKRRAAINAGPIDRIYIEDLAAMCSNRCGICGRKVKVAERTIDHIVPLSKGGLHVWSNVQLAHGRCNSGKGARLLGGVQPRLPILTGELHGTEA